MSNPDKRGKICLVHVEDNFADVSDRVHRDAYYAQTDIMQARFYPPTHFVDSGAADNAVCMDIAEMVQLLLKEKRWTQMKLAEHFGVAQSTVNRWKGGAEPEGHHRDAIRALYQSQFGEISVDSSTVPLMGYIGAGAEIMPEFEQVPPDGLDQVHVPFAMPEDMIAFGVRGDSMLPVYKDGAVIIVHREQKRPLEAFYGEDAAVRTADGRRFIKTIMRGANGLVNLYSFNSAPIEDQRLEWIGEIFAVLPPLSLKKVGKQGGIQGQLQFSGGRA